MASPGSAAACAAAIAAAPPEPLAAPPPLIDTSLPGALTDWMPPYAYPGRGRLADKGVGDAGGVVADGAEAGIKSSIPPGLRALVDTVRAGRNPMREVLVQLLSQGASIPEAGVALAREELSRPDLNQGDAVVYGGAANSSDGVGYFYARCIRPIRRCGRGRRNATPEARRQGGILDPRAERQARACARGALRQP